ncbi:MAG: tetratricopeptide repeat protein [Thermoplasmata archaeon]
MEAGRRAIGEDAFKTNKGHFWGIIKTRPFMRAMEGLAETLWRMGKRKEAVQIYEELLELNPDDNQGNRYALLLLYMLTFDMKNAQGLLDRYDEDSAVWNYDRALLLFLRDGITADASEAIRQGFESNPYVAPMLLGIVPVPPIGNYITPGHPDEAASYVASSYSLWVDNAAALKWLENELLSFIGGRKK